MDIDEKEGIPTEDVLRYANTIVRIVQWAKPAHTAIKAAGRLMPSIIAVAQARLDEKKAEIDVRRLGYEIELVRQDRRKKLVSTLGEMIGARMANEEATVEDITWRALERIAIEEVENDIRHEQEDDVDTTWLDHFRREASLGTTERMKETYARILAGEMRNPNTFSIDAVKTIATIDKKTAEIFQTACSLSVGLDWTDMKRLMGGAPLHELHDDRRVPQTDKTLGENGLRKYGLGYGELCNLMDCRLMQTDLNSWMEYEVCVVREITGKKQIITPMQHQGRKWALVQKQGHRQERKSIKLTGAKLSRIGVELFKIVDIKKNERFLEELKAHFEKQHLEMVEIA